MAFRKDAEFQEVLNEEAIKGTVFNRGEQEETNVHPDYPASCPAILEPSNDEPLFKREIIRKPLKTYKAIMRSFNSTEIHVNSDEPSNDGELGQRTDGWLSGCAHLSYHHKKFVAILRESNYLCIIQSLWMLLPFFAIMMGMKYADCCPGSPGLPAVTVFTGILGLMLIGQWMVIENCRYDDSPCGRQQTFLIFLFILVVAMLELEIYLFSKQPFSFEPLTTNYCSKEFYDYTYTKFIASACSMFCVALFYMPSYMGLLLGVD